MRGLSVADALRRKLAHQRVRSLLGQSSRRRFKSSQMSSYVENLPPWSADLGDQYPLVKSIFDFLPDASALVTTAMTKEFVGLAVYPLRGWA
jgi:hypothetical protein